MSCIAKNKTVEFRLSSLVEVKFVTFEERSKPRVFFPCLHTSIESSSSKAGKKEISLSLMRAKGKKFNLLCCVSAFFPSCSSPAFFSALSRNNVEELTTSNAKIKLEIQ